MKWLFKINTEFFDNRFEKIDFSLNFFRDFAPNFYKNKLSVDLLILDGYNNYGVKSEPPA